MSEFTHHDFGSHDASHGHHDVHHDHPAHDVSELYGTAAASVANPAVHGDPAQAAHFWFKQQGGHDCVVASVTQILSEATGHRVSETAVLDHMQQLHLPLPADKGLPIEVAQQVLQSYHVPSHMEVGTSLHQLESYLDEGRSVIFGVDGDPIWHWQDGTTQGEAPHAVMVTSIDAAKGIVTLSDTGNPDGNEEKVPLDVFMHAWAAEQSSVLVTDVVVDHHPGPALLPLTLNPHHHDATATTHVAPQPHTYTPTGPAQPAHHTTTTEPAPSTSYTVKTGDTLWNIAEHAYGHGDAFTQIAQANGITNPDMIKPGQVLTIPAAE